MTKVTNEIKKLSQNSSFISAKSLKKKKASIKALKSKLTNDNNNNNVNNNNVNEEERTPKNSSSFSRNLVVPEDVISPQSSMWILRSPHFPTSPTTPLGDHRKRKMSFSQRKFARPDFTDD